jgi:two-component system sensor histidine kinase SenX3
MTVVAAACLLLVLAAGAVSGAMFMRRRDDAVIEQLLDGEAHHAVDSRPAFAALDRRLRAGEVSTGQARAAEERLGAVLDGFSQAVILFDAEGRSAYANQPGAVLLAGRHGEALVMAAVRDLLTVVGRADAPSAARRLELVGPPKQSFDIVVRVLSGGERIAIVEDVSEHRRLEDVRRDIVANISHELKTPIGAMALLAETMSVEDSPELLARLASRIQSEALRVTMTNDDLLLLSRIEADEQGVRELLVIDDVVAEAVARIAQAAESRRIEIRTELAAPPLRARGDRRQLVSALFNLLENAVKYSEAGSVVVLEAARNGGDIDLAVSDHGVGIPARDLERIFERFYRVDRARSRTTGGTGLGLAIVRHVAQNHAGQVRVRSVEGEGSTFMLTIPADHVPRPADHVPRSADLDSRPPASPSTSELDGCAEPTSAGAATGE